MTGPPQMASEADRTVAAEFVLGTLDRDERKIARARLAADPQFAALVRQWERRLAPLHELAVPVAPPPRLWSQVLADLDAAHPGPRVRPAPEPSPRPAPAAPRRPDRPAPAPGLVARLRRRLAAQFRPRGQPARLPVGVPPPPRLLPPERTLEGAIKAATRAGLLPPRDVPLPVPPLPVPPAGAVAAGAPALPSGQRVALPAAPAAKASSPSAAKQATAKPPAVPARPVAAVPPRPSAPLPPLPSGPRPPPEPLAPPPAFMFLEPEPLREDVPTGAEPDPPTAQAPPQDDTQDDAPSVDAAHPPADAPEPVAADTPPASEPADPDGAIEGDPAPDAAPAGEAGELPPWAEAVASGTVSALPDPDAGLPADDIGDIADDPRQAMLERKLLRWRIAAAGLLALSLGLGGFAAYRTFLKPDDGQWVAVLRTPDAPPAVAVRIDSRSGAFHVRAFAPSPEVGEIYRLWLISGPRAVLLGAFASGLSDRSPAVARMGTAALRAAEVLVTREPVARSAPDDAAPGGTVVWRGRLAPD